jgi:hypothetical protein
VTSGNKALHEKIDRLSNREADVVEDFVDALLKPIYSEEIPQTWLTAPAWKDAFLARLRGHHALSIEPLSTTQFEAAFNYACVTSGWHVEAAGSATQRFFDTTISNGEGVARKLSLKSSSAKDMRVSTIHISKLTEAAWIQDVRRQADRRNSIVALFDEYRTTTSSIVMLRGFADRDGYQVRYELVEIPTSIFAPVAGLTVEQAQASTIRIPPGSTPQNAHFAIRIDRGDAKITLTGVRLEQCIVHGRWGLARSSRAGS